MKRAIAIIITAIITIVIFANFTLSYAISNTSIPTSAFQNINFSDKNTYTGTKINVAVSTRFEGWHYSNSEWRFVGTNISEPIIIKDTQIEDLFGGELKVEDLSASRTATLSLPKQVIDYIKDGGEISNLKIKFNTGSMESEDIFNGTCTYKINTNNTMDVKFTPIFRISDRPIYSGQGMNVKIPQGRPNASFTTFSIFDRNTGSHLGMGYDQLGVTLAGYKGAPINPEDIKNSYGDLKAGSYSYGDNDDGHIVNFNSPNAGIGKNTFANGGAVGLSFIFPINAEIYIPNNEPTPTPSPTPTPIVTTIGSSDGCFLAKPRKDGNTMVTYIIRGSHTPITEPVKIKIKYYVIQNNTAVNYFEAYPETSVKNKLKNIVATFDDYITFTPEKPFWVQKVTYPVPQKEHGSGLFIMTGQKDIDGWNAVKSDTYSSGNLLLFSTNTMSDNHLMDFLPWSDIEKEIASKYGDTKAKRLNVIW